MDVPEQLQEGLLFDRVDDDNAVLEYDLTFGVDDRGFYVWWRQEGRPVEVLDTTQIFEVRYGTLPKVRDTY